VRVPLFIWMSMLYEYTKVFDELRNGRDLMSRPYPGVPKWLRLP
jgi:hypothetical protein